ncbi:MAG: anti-sigma factor antagonist [Clostridia bacterium]|nr:anti-sigma factor antagonist [Clostridia bacterium]
MKETVKTELQGRTLTVTIIGEIDHHSARKLREEIDSALFYHRPKTLRLLLSQVSFMDSSGLGLILGRLTRMKELGGDMVLVSPTKEIDKILTLAAIDKTIPTERSVRKEDTE